MTGSKNVKIKRALLSVSDKTGLIEFAQRLNEYGIELVSTGGTAKALQEAGLPVTPVQSLTQFPEMMDGRVKTLHPAVHGGLLADRDNVQHMQAAQEHTIQMIDLVVVNLYPFEKTVQAQADRKTCIENIDIGGPAMIRASAKNHAHVTVVVSPVDYATVLEDMENLDGGTSVSTRQELALKAFSHTAAYDSAISQWFIQDLGVSVPEEVILAGRLKQALRYGENPHQSAAFYVNNSQQPGVATAEQIQGKKLSYNNIADTDAAFNLVSEFSEPACAIIKHANPCGVSTHSDLITAYEQAFACDATSAFGGIVAFNRPLDAQTAKRVIETFTEVVIAPEIDPDAQEIFAQKKNLRLMRTGGLVDTDFKTHVLKQVTGGFLYQTADTGCLQISDLKVVTKRQPTDEELKDLMFAWTVAKHVKSNAIIYAKNKMTLGVGAGQMSRLDSTRIAAHKAQDIKHVKGFEDVTLENCVVASDAFFPFPDGLLTAAEAGAKAVIQPGGSIKDQDVISAADKAGLAMVFTGVRHFRH